MSAPSITGSVLQIQSSNASASQNISIPADAELCLFMSADWLSDWVTLDSVTLNGDDFSEGADYGNANTETARIWTYEVPEEIRGTTKSLAWEFSTEPLEGANIFIVFVKDYSGIDGFGGNQRTGNGTVTSSNITSTDNSLVLCVVASYGSVDANAAPSGSGQSEVADSTLFNQDQGAVGTKAGQSGNVTMSGSGDYAAICCISISGTISDIVVTLGAAACVALASVGDVRYESLRVSCGYASVYALASVGNVAIIGGVPPLGEGDTPGFILWCLANSYYQNIGSSGIDPGLEAPTGDNATMWGDIFFGS